ncbi:MAG: hypothetical protein FWC41_09430 [Firmicutes bacterium]|nr:hypothetical protein [Bacillota bacterium]
MKKNLLILFLIILVIVAGCKRTTKKENKEDKPTYNLSSRGGYNIDEDERDNEDIPEGDFCSNLNIDNPDKVIPIINKFLSELPEDLAGQEKMQALVEWLNIQPCINTRASIKHYSAIKTNPPTGEIQVRFVIPEFPFNRLYVMDVLWTNPMTVAGFHDLYYEHKDIDNR